MNWRVLSIPVLACLSSFLSVPYASQTAGPVRLSITAANQQFDQGGIFRILVESEKPIEGLDASFDQKKLVFYSCSSKRTWASLAGIDLETKVGEHPLEGKILFEDNHSQEIHRAIRILLRRFPEQRITVDEKYVTLNPEDQKRAEEESKRLDILWGSVSPERLW